MHKTQNPRHRIPGGSVPSRRGARNSAGGNVVTDWNTRAISVIITKGGNRRGASQPLVAYRIDRCL